MCSIGGFVSSKPLNRNTVKMLATSLLWYGSERGNQSAGLHVNGATTKQASKVADFLDSSQFHNAFENDSQLLLTHTRMPTCGGIGDSQAQPFQINDTVSIHNGMYFDTKGIKTRWNIKKPSGVDSELVTRFVESYGVKRLPEFLANADGVSAIAVKWNGKLYAMRYGNPLYHCELETCEGVKVSAFASARDSLMRAMSYVWLVPPSVKPKELAEGSLFTMTPSGPRQISKSIGKAWDRWGDESYNTPPRDNKHTSNKKRNASISDAEIWWRNEVEREKRKG